MKFGKHIMLKQWDLYFTHKLQEGNVANQREHLILLIANVQMRQLSKPDQRLKVLFC